MKSGLIIGLVLATACAAYSGESEVTVANAKAGITLAGTLARPDGKLKAVLVLATGSGAQNRDEEVFGLRPFKVISDYLSDRGYAVLRMDDRGTGSSTGDFASATGIDFTTDIEAGVSYADSVFGGKIPVGVLGHSEGGQTAIRIASRKGCDFIVTLAAPAWAGDSVIMAQSRAMAVAMTGEWDGEALQRKIMALAKSDLPTVLVRPMLVMELGNAVGEAAKLPEVRKQLDAQVDAVLSPWYRSMLRYDPTDDIKAVAVPWLALNGSKDTQVLPSSLSTISELCPGDDTLMLDGRNHLFQKAVTGLVNEYASSGQTPDDETLKTIADWLDKNIAQN